jgi:arginine exporter protein ArgO
VPVEGERGDQAVREMGNEVADPGFGAPGAAETIRPRGRRRVPPENRVARAPPPHRGSGHDRDHRRSAVVPHRPIGAGPAAVRSTAEVDALQSVTAALVAGLLAGYGIALPVGAIATYLVALTARTTLRTGAFAALGVATADGLYALVAAVAGSAVTPVIRPIMVPMRWVSALVLIALAVRSAVRTIRRYRRTQAAVQAGEAPVGPVRAYVALLGLTMMNPITVVYFAALVLGDQSTAAPDHLRQVVFVLAAFAASASWQLVLAGGGALLGRALTGGRGRLITTVTSSAVICALALRLLATAG